MMKNGGMTGKKNRSTWRKPAPVPLCQPQTPHAARTRTRAAAVGSQRLTALRTALPFGILLWHLQVYIMRAVMNLLKFAIKND
jgi:hypothetical protein